MKTPRWWPFQEKRRWIIGGDLPEPYVRLAGLTNVWAPYRRKAAFLFFLGIGIIAMFDIPGLFFTNPYTHVVEGWSAYLGILGAITIGVLGFVALWGFQFYKDSEVAPFDFGGFLLRVRKSIRIPFHAIVGTIEKIEDDIAEKIMAVIDRKLEEVRQLQKVQPIPKVNVTPNDGAPTSPTQNPLAPPQKPPEALLKAEGGKLNLFYLPLPSLLQKCGVPGIMHLSTADSPEQLHNELPGEWIWEGWLRHAKGETWDLAIVAEWPFLSPTDGTTQCLIPITCAAGTYYDFTWGLERALNPPVLNSGVVEKAMLNADARVVGQEAIGQVVLYRSALQAERQLKPQLMELGTEIAGNVLNLMVARNEIGVKPQDKNRGAKVGAYVGVAVVVSVLGFVGWLALHGWKFG